MRAAVEVIAEDGFEGASARDMAPAAVSRSALYHHFPSKLGLLREFLDEAYAVTLARIERRLDGVEGAVARLENVVGTLVWTHVHDEFARASIVAVDTAPRRGRPRRRRGGARRCSTSSRASCATESGRRPSGPTSRGRSRAVVSLSSSLVGVYGEIDRPLDDVIALYQRFAVSLAGASGSRRRV